MAPVRSSKTDLSYLHAIFASLPGKRDERGRGKGSSAEIATGKVTSFEHVWRDQFG